MISFSASNSKDHQQTLFYRMLYLEPHLNQYVLDVLRNVLMVIHVLLLVQLIVTVLLIKMVQLVVTNAQPNSTWFLILSKMDVLVHLVMKLLMVGVFPLQPKVLKHQRISALWEFHQIQLML